MILKASNLTKRYGKKEVLKGLDFEIEKPGIYAVLGKNGAGKTTFFRLLTSIEKSDDGKIEISGQTDLDRKIGYLPTDQYFYPRILGKEYLQFCLHARKMPVNDYEKYNDLFELPLKTEVRSYSSGMKKKLGIMGLLLQDNSIYLLDEPYNGLDIESVMLVGKIIEKLALQGKTVILSSHILSSITDITKNIFYLKNGVLTDYREKSISSLTEELLSGDKLSKLDSFFK
ncbi:MAG: ABC-2 type transport system ATP-binding protein [Patiriisocius sp.]|jgi:ABC-2 type transport system ATP-binding protein